MTLKLDLKFLWLRDLWSMSFRPKGQLNEKRAADQLRLTQPYLVSIKQIHKTPARRLEGSKPWRGVRRHFDVLASSTIVPIAIAIGTVTLVLRP